MSSRKVRAAVPLCLAETRGIGSPPDPMWEEFVVAYPSHSSKPRVFRINSHIDSKAFGGTGQPVPSEFIPDGELRDIVLAADEYEQGIRGERQKSERASKALVSAFLKRVDGFVKIAGGGPGPFGGSPPYFVLPNAEGDICFIEFPLTGGHSNEKTGGWQLYKTGPYQKKGQFTVAVNAAAQVVAYAAEDLPPRE